MLKVILFKVSANNNNNNIDNNNANYVTGTVSVIKLKLRKKTLLCVVWRIRDHPIEYNGLKLTGLIGPVVTRHSAVHFLVFLTHFRIYQKHKKTFL
jgi:hypothetical protein